MSYSVSAKGATHDEAKQAIAMALNGVLDNQEVHKVDIEQAKAVANAFIDVLSVPVDKDIAVTVSGSLGWAGTLPDIKITSSQVSVYASFVTKE